MMRKAILVMVSLTVALLFSVSVALIVYPLLVVNAKSIPGYLPGDSLIYL